MTENLDVKWEPIPFPRVARRLKGLGFLKEEGALFRPFPLWGSPEPIVYRVKILPLGLSLTSKQQTWKKGGWVDHHAKIGIYTDLQSLVTVLEAIIRERQGVPNRVFWWHQPKHRVQTPKG